MDDPLGWRSDLAQDESFGLDETTAWDETDGADVFVEAFFFVPAMPVLTWRPDSARADEIVLFRTLVTRFESGKEQRRAKGSSRRRWKLHFRKDQVDGDALWALYLARNGPAEPFLWESHIDGQVYLVRFPTTMSRRVLWRSAYESGLELIEVV